jgi:hypothetical protein
MYYLERATGLKRKLLFFLLLCRERASRVSSQKLYSRIRRARGNNQSTSPAVKDEAPVESPMDWSLLF